MNSYQSAGTVFELSDIVTMHESFAIDMLLRATARLQSRSMSFPKRR